MSSSKCHDIPKEIKIRWLEEVCLDDGIHGTLRSQVPLIIDIELAPASCL